MCFKEKQKELRLDRGRKARGIAARGVPVHVAMVSARLAFKVPTAWLSVSTVSEHWWYFWF